MCEALEHGVVERLPIDQLLVGGRLDVFPDVVASRYLQISLSGNVLRVAANRYIGIIPLNDRVVVRVSPKTPLANLAHMIAAAVDEPHYLKAHLRGYERANTLLPIVLEAIVDAFLDAVENVLVNGLLQDYEAHRTSTSFPKGLVEIGNTMRLVARGVRHRLAVSWFERSFDNAPNRMLKYALVMLASYYSRTDFGRDARSTRQRVNAYFARMRAVQFDRTRAFRRDTRVRDSRRLPFSRAYYARAILLAELLIGRHGIDLGVIEGSVRAGTLLLDLEAVFEAYVRATLVRDASSSRESIRVLHGESGPPSGAARPLFDPPSTRPRVTPDIVVRDVAASSSIVIDVKYKPLSSEKLPDRNDVNQIVTYAVAYRARAGVLVQPAAAPRDKGLRLLGAIDATRLYSYAMDLSSTELDAEEVVFVDTIVRLFDA